MKWLCNFFHKWGNWFKETATIEGRGEKPFSVQARYYARCNRKEIELL